MLDADGLLPSTSHGVYLHVEGVSAVSVCGGTDKPPGELNAWTLLCALCAQSAPRGDCVQHFLQGLRFLRLTVQGA